MALYVGDWDPSGLHMSAVDLPGRLHTYRVNHCDQQGLAWWPDEQFQKTEITIERVALAAEDVSDPELPSFALDTKRGDPRHGWYLGQRYGPRCWELDALSPVILRERVKAAIVAHLNLAVWDRYVLAERVELENITASVRAWRGLAVEPA
jgi:hypothetical protein